MNIKVKNLFLDQTVGIGDTLMLTQMLGPRFRLKRFRSYGPPRRHPRHTPSVSAVPPKFPFDPIERLKELSAVFAVDSDSTVTMTGP